MHRARVWPWVAAITVFVLSQAALAEIPQMMNYQGRITDNASGDPYEGNATILFSLWNAETDGDSLWGEVHSSVNVSNGLFSVGLGTFTSIPASAFDGVDCWLKMIVNGEEIQPRTRLVSVSYAYKTLVAENALHADSAVYADTSSYSFVSDSASFATNSTFADTSGFAWSIADDAVTGAKIQDGTIELSDIGSNGADSGQVMKFDGTIWTVADDEGSTGFFPAPAWESGWIYIGFGGVTLDHNLGQDPNRYVIDMQFKDVDGGMGTNNHSFGMTQLTNGIWWGAAWNQLDSNSIGILRYSTDGFADSIRVRIWIVQ